MVRNNGGTVVSSVTKSLDYLIIGEKAGSKRRKAGKLGVTLMTEDEFMAVVEGGGALPERGSGR
jgi:DNA ligase (NAD+)